MINRQIKNIGQFIIKIILKNSSEETVVCCFLLPYLFNLKYFIIKYSFWEKIRLFKAKVMLSKEFLVSNGFCVKYLK